MKRYVSLCLVLLLVSYCIPTEAHAATFESDVDYTPSTLFNYKNVVW